jgi:hypothetical protein
MSLSPHPTPDSIENLPLNLKAVFCETNVPILTLGAMAGRWPGETQGQSREYLVYTHRAFCTIGVTESPSILGYGQDIWTQVSKLTD